MLQLKQWMTTVVLAGLIAAIGMIVLTSVDDGSVTNTPAEVAPSSPGDSVQSPILILPEQDEQSPLTPIQNSTPLPTQIFDPTPTPPPTRNHTVQAGESLYNIALANGITVEDILAFNSLVNPDRLEVGQVLIIPLK
ncbi:MAG: LysM peptidoglycan-binding domain-containing protein [Candidatus Promineifilaceae bacterium]